ncbi:hypothetical protein [Blastococcus xanthinilyticus]|uniref:Uncharacterized protein n=1 Tax=Blastococcus xanthinilyticus TaxID=1564164 RepID=A0A5S5D3Y5_9ACTN|nr:hypothetical protein [Blastococcus xanthinilyticus]TYP89978.1 hypothetical protein BD833_102457 [Blastococcus xanthinilyticus]
MLTASPDTFAALARSSPWRWSTLRFTVSWPGDPWQTTPVRAWLRRPDALRVEALDGELLQAGRASRSRVALLSPGGGRTVTEPWPSDPGAPAPTWRPDGLVAERPQGLSLDDPMYQNYFWVAVLDPAELADPGLDADPGEPALLLDAVTEVEHAGRPAWEAVVRTTPAYEPRCGCCPLLRSREVDLAEYDGDAAHLLAVYPDAFRVRLDVQTGVCVLTEAIGGEVAGRGHDLRIEAVDEPMADDLFAEPRRGLFGRRGRSGPPQPGLA